MKNFCAGIVLFNPNIDRLRENLTAICKQVEFVFIQDNGSVNIKSIKELISEFDNILLTENPTNKGIAWALNRLCEKAYENNFKWILTLDQDSVCPSNMIILFKEDTDLDNIAIICPCIKDHNVGELDKSKKQKENIKECITSGALLRLEAWKSISGFDELMFIDGVDFEFCYRLKTSKWNIYRDNRVVLFHEIGESKMHKFMGFKVIVKNHSSIRKYYIARNIIYLAKKKNIKHLVLKVILQEIKLFCIVLLYENDKCNKISEILRGIKDGLKMNIYGREKQ